MDLVNSISSLQQAQVMAKVQFAAAKRIMDVQQMQGSAAVKLIDAATQNVCQAGDKLVASAIGLGSQIDTYG